MGLDDFRAQDVLDNRYQLLQRIGQGGFGDVWRAVELFADGTPFRDVALKLLAPELAGAGWAEEAKLLASFQHPSLVTIFAAGVLKTGGTPFVAMEFLEGETLADVLRRKRRLGWRETLRIARDVAAALDVIHSKGIVHLDLKPANFFVTKPDASAVDSEDGDQGRKGARARGTIKVLDFGLSRKQGARPRAFASRPMSDDASIATGVLYDGTDPFAETQTVGSSRRTIAGTPGFVAPEVIEFLEPTSAADAYALGATIVQLITGHLPHAVEDEPRDLSNPETVRSWWLELREATLRGSLRDLEKEGLPRGLAALVRRLLSVDPTARGCPPGTLFAQLDEVWARPFGVPLRPFPGLTPYDASYEGVLFGRDGDATRLVRDLTYESALVIAGPRGAGKTSLLVAGVLPQLAKSEVDGKEDWRAVFVDPTAGDGAADTRVADIVWRMRPEDRPDTPHTLALSATEISEEHTEERALPTDPVVVAVDPPRKAKVRAAAAAMQTLKSIDHDDGGASLDAADEDDESPPPAATSGFTTTGVRTPTAATPKAGASDSPSTVPATQFAAVVSAISEGATGVALVVDPLEALLDLQPSQRKALVELIHDVVHASKAHGLRFIATVDSQRIGEVVETCGFDATVRAAIRFVDQPLPASGADIAVGPLRLSGMKIEDPEGLARDAEAALREKGSLPFLAASLAHWWDERAGKKFLSTARYRELGGVKAALFDQAKAAHDALPRNERAELLALMTEMATTEGKVVERTAAELGELIENREGAERYVDALVRRYLARRHGARVVLADDRLIEWPPLAGARLAAMERLAARERFREAALAWDRSGQRKELLEGRAFLNELDRHDGALRGLSQTESEYLTTCRRAARRRRIIGTALVVATLGLVVGLYFGERFLERQRQEAIAKKEAAVRESYRASLLGRAQQTADPYEATALIIEAIQKGSASPQVSVELMDATRNLVPARFISRDSVQDLDFPWDARWVIGRGRTGTVVAIDLAPPKGETEPVEEGETDSSSLNEKLLRRRPHLIEVQPSDSPIAEIAPFGFDTAFATRGAAGEVRVVRLTEEGEAVLVAAPELVCQGKLAVAKSAPVVACTTDSGIGAWDLRTGRVTSKDLSVDGATLSPDGAWLAAWVGKKLHLLETASMSAKSLDVVEDVLTAKFAPKEPLLAVVTKNRFEVFDARSGARVFEGPALGANMTAPPSDLYWDDGGLDLSICSAEGAHAVYLRRGGRASLDVEPRVRCDDRPANAPAVIREADRAEYGPLERKAAGMHLSYGGFRVGESRYLTRSLAVFSSKNEGLERATQFVERDDKGAALERAPEDAFVEVLRSGEFIAVEHQKELLLVDAKGRKTGSQEGAHLLGVCTDGRIAAWKKDGDVFRVFDARTSSDLGAVPRDSSTKGALVVGLSPACDKLYVERLDGTLWMHPLGSGSGDARVIAALDGYVFDRKFLQDRSGLVVAVSSGAVARIDARADTVSVVGYGTPRASAIASGPGIGEITFADSTGVLVARKNGAVDRVLEGTGADSWDDIAIVDGGRSMLLGATKGISVLDVKEREIVLTSKDTEGLTRFTPWDAEGSLLAFNPNLEGQVRGFIVPFSRTLALSLGPLASNLRVQDGRITLVH